MRDVNVVISEIENDNYIHFKIDDKIELSHKFGNFLMYIVKAHTNSFFLEIDPNEYVLRSPHNIHNVSQIQNGDRFIANILFVKNNHYFIHENELSYYPYVSIKNNGKVVTYSNSISRQFKDF